MKARIYCDGACSGNPGPGGWAGIILLPTEKLKISGNEKETTNNRMELRAALESIRAAILSGYTHIDVYSDSAYVVNAVKKEWLKKWAHNGWKTSNKDTSGELKDVKNRDLWEIMLRLTNKYRDINFVKVKGHAGDKYNEDVDMLARAEVEKVKGGKE
jgi:ribonuclease HI